MNTRLHQNIKAWQRQTKCTYVYDCLNRGNLCIQCLYNERSMGAVDYYDNYDLRHLRRMMLREYKEELGST